MATMNIDLFGEGTVTSSRANIERITVQCHVLPRIEMNKYVFSSNDQYFLQSHCYGVSHESKHSKSIQSPDDKHCISHQQPLTEEELPRAL